MIHQVRGFLRIQDNSSGVVAPVSATAPVNTDPGLYVRVVSGSVVVTGSSSDNSANSTTKIPVIPARANALAPAWTEGNQVPLSTDLFGAQRISVNQGGNTAPVKNTSPVSTDYGLVSRNTPRVESVTVSTTPLVAGTGYVGAWQDTMISGTRYVTAMAYADVSSEGLDGLLLEECDVNTNNDLRTLVDRTHLIGGTFCRVEGTIRARYWRVAYYNGAVNQATFLLVATESTHPQEHDNNYTIGVPLAGFKDMAGLGGALQLTDQTVQPMVSNQGGSLVVAVNDLFNIMNDILKELKLSNLYFGLMTDENLDYSDVETIG